MQETQKQLICYKRVELSDLCRQLSREEIRQRIDHLCIRVAPSASEVAGERRKARLVSMEAKFVSVCFQCGHQISYGADILFDPVKRKARHQVCPPLHGR